MNNRYSFWGELHMVSNFNPQAAATEVEQEFRSMAKAFAEALHATAKARSDLDKMSNLSESAVSGIRGSFFNPKNKDLYQDGIDKLQTLRQKVEPGKIECDGYLNLSPEEKVQIQSKI